MFGKIKYLGTTSSIFTNGNVYDVLSWGPPPQVLRDNGHVGDATNFHDLAIWETVYVAIIEQKQLKP
jgi:hypothetical protein